MIGVWAALGQLWLLCAAREWCGCRHHPLAGCLQAEDVRALPSFPLQGHLLAQQQKLQAQMEAMGASIRQAVPGQVSRVLARLQIRKSVGKSVGRGLHIARHATR